MSKSTVYHTKNGSITGKTVTQRSGGYTTTNDYKASGSGLSRTIFGPAYSASSTTVRDPKGNTRTKTY